MKHITAAKMAAFTDELGKEAGLAKALAFGRKHLAGRFGRQLGLGAGAGAVGGGAMAKPGEEGKGALKGALVGAGLAGGRILATKGGRAAALQKAKNFKQKQVYSLTGKGIEGTPKERLARAKEIGVIRKAPEAPEKVHKGIRGKLQAHGGRKAQEAYAAEQQAFQEGLLNVPGAAHGMLTRPGHTLKRGWQRSGGLDKGFAGLGAYEGASGFARKPQEGGPGRMESGMRGLGMGAGYLVAPTTMLGSLALGEGGAALGGAAGKATSAVAGAVKAKPKGQVVPRHAYYGQGGN